MSTAQPTFSRPLALVTGASSGIGADLARELVYDGYDVALVARREGLLTQLAEELRGLGAQAHVLAVDLTEPAAVDRLLEQLGRASAAPVEVLINNAGIGENLPFVALEAGRMQTMLQLNVVALTTLTHRLVPAMVARGCGRIMMVASVASFLPGPGAAVYHATKAYVRSFGEALGHELRGSGISVTTLCPGATATEYAQTAHAEGAKVFANGALSPVMSSPTVAKRGYAGMKKGKALVVPGPGNRLTVAALPFLPRRLVLQMMADLNAPRS